MCSVWIYFSFGLRREILVVVSGHYLEQGWRWASVGWAGLGWSVADAQAEEGQWPENWSRARQDPGPAAGDWECGSAARWHTGPGDLNAGHRAAAGMRGNGTRDKIHFHHNVCVTLCADLPASLLWSEHVMTPRARDICWWHEIMTWWHSQTSGTKTEEISLKRSGWVRTAQTGSRAPSINYNYVNHDRG